MMKLLLAVVFAVSCAGAAAQESQSLGDAARQAKEQKQRSEAKTAQSSDPRAPSKFTHVITNDEIPEHSEITNTAPPSVDAPVLADKDQKHPAQFWKSRILETKRAMASLQRNIDALNNSIHFSQGNYETQVAWNERQRQKLQEVENMKSQLDRLQKHLEELQEAARNEGYGSSVYEP